MHGSGLPAAPASGSRTQPVLMFHLLPYFSACVGEMTHGVAYSLRAKSLSAGNSHFVPAVELVLLSISIDYMFVGSYMYK